LHRYDNQDHAMLTGIQAARGLASGERVDLWAINRENTYLESAAVRSDADDSSAREAVPIEVFRRFHRLALGISTGVVCAVVAFLTTLACLLFASETNGLAAFVSLLSQYYPGYSLSAMGCLSAAIYGAGTGLVAGWSFAVLRNALTMAYLRFVAQRMELPALRRILDYL
ncbi:MAG: hypothetical protein AAGI88_24905, partial [Pseudomonadota bacterium]